MIAHKGLSYRFSKDETSKNIRVEKGSSLADPDLAKFGDRYNLYPATDGFTGWSGTQFPVLSSGDLREWRDEGVILDLATDDVPWAVGSAWAPAIASKGGSYYSYYFCGKRNSGESAIGVAVAENPAGPFRAHGN